MGLPAAKQGDRVEALDIHILIVSNPTPTPTPTPQKFEGILDGGLSSDVRIGGLAAATVGSTATNTPAHPVNPATPFQRPPTNKAAVQAGSPTVRINGRPAARAGDPALTCNDPVDQPVGRVVVPGGTVRIG